jgi:sugar/nucleoside kinase (ribokinase family)
MARGARLVSVGSIIADVRLDVPHLPARGGDVIGSAATVTAGGGFNILCAAARQGLAALFAGWHGAGPYGDRIRADLAREGIATFHRPAPEGDSGFCLVMVEPDGERTFVSSPGVEALLGRRRLADVALAPGDTVFVSGYDLCYPQLGPAIADWAAAIPREVRLVVDPGPLAGEIPDAILRAVMPHVAIWTMNRREAGLMTGKTLAGEVWPIMRQRLRPDAWLVLRDGAKGAFIFMGGIDVPLLVPSPAVTMIDSTGAGDTHTGVLIAALSQGHEPAVAMRRANAAAALSVTRRGPATAPSRAELDQFLAAAGPAARAMRERNEVTN